MVELNKIRKESNMHVSVHLENQSQPIEFEDVVNTYQKGDMFCLYLSNGTVQKFPIMKIFRVVEDYQK